MPITKKNRPQHKYAKPNLASLKSPGIYMIRNIENDYKYYGESKNCSGRCASHRHRLCNNCHDNDELQNDWNKYGEDSFIFVTLTAGPEWESRVKRHAREIELITRDWAKAYNLCVTRYDHADDKNPLVRRSHTQFSKDLISEALRNKPNDKLGRPISIDGVEYPSLAEGSRQTGFARQTIRKRILDPNYPAYIVLPQNNNS